MELLNLCCCPCSVLPQFQISSSASGLGLWWPHGEMKIRSVYFIGRTENICRVKSPWPRTRCPLPFKKQLPSPLKQRDRYRYRPGPPTHSDIPVLIELLAASTTAEAAASSCEDCLSDLCTHVVRGCRLCSGHWSIFEPDIAAVKCSSNCAVSYSTH